MSIEKLTENERLSLELAGSSAERDIQRAVDEAPPIDAEAFWAVQGPRLVERVVVQAVATAVFDIMDDGITPSDPSSEPR